MLTKPYTINYNEQHNSIMLDNVDEEEDIIMPEKEDAEEDINIIPS